MRDGLYDTAHHQPEKESHQENDEMRHDAPCAHANSVPRPEALRYHYRFTRRVCKDVVGRCQLAGGTQRLSAIAESPRPYSFSPLRTLRR